MSHYTVEKMQDEPIILVTIVGFLNVEMAKSIYREIAKIAKNLEGPIFRITDVRQEQTTFQEIISVVKEAAKGSAGSTTDPRIQNVFVGTEKMARVARDILRNVTGNVMPMFETLEEALTHIRQELANKKGEPNG